MRFLFLVLTMVSGTSAWAHININADRFVGVYTSKEYVSQISDRKATVEIVEVSPQKFQLIFQIPCGSKTSPKVFDLTIAQNGATGQLNLVDEGSSQCFTGSNPEIHFYGSSIGIITNPRIITPGFNGGYRLSVEQ